MVVSAPPPPPAVAMTSADDAAAAARSSEDDSKASFGAAASASASSVACGGGHATTSAAADFDDYDSRRLARAIHAIDRLTSVYGFPDRLANAAVEECGPPSDDYDYDYDYDGEDFVVACYNWILDNHGDVVVDNGGPVVPRTDCPHVVRHVGFRIVVVDDDGTARVVVDASEDGGSSSAAAAATPTTTTTTTTATATRTAAPEFPRPRPGGNYGDLMTLECQHRDDARRGNRSSSRRRRRTSRDVGGGKKAPTSVVGRSKREEDYEADLDRHDGDDIATTEGEEDDDGGMRCPPGMNWLCLECGAMMCSRYANGHAKVHYEDTKRREEEEEEEEDIVVDDRGAGGEEVVDDITRRGVVVAAEGHCVAVSLADLSVWCYGCNAYLRHPTLDVLTKYLEGLKFGTLDLDAYIVMTNSRNSESIVIGRDFSYARSREPFES